MGSTSGTVDDPHTEPGRRVSPLGAALPTLPAAPGSGRAARTRRPPSPVAVGGRYRLLESLGRGSTGLVWLAHDRVLGRRVALKRLESSGASGAERALHEARATARVAHPNVVVVHDVMVDRDGHAWIVMQALDGVTLAARSCSQGGLPVASVHRIAEAMVGALDAVHARGLVHRDVKPSNIHLGVDGRVVLTDLGVAASLARACSEPDLITGTLGYIAPESVVGGCYSPVSDLYGLGAALWYAIQGSPPFDIRTVEDLIEHAAAASSPPRAQRAGWLEPMITGLLQPDPAARWTAGRAMAYLRGLGPVHRTGGSRGVSKPAAAPRVA